MAEKVYKGLAQVGAKLKELLNERYSDTDIESIFVGLTKPSGFGDEGAAVFLADRAEGYTERSLRDWIKKYANFYGHRRLALERTPEEIAAAKKGSKLEQAKIRIKELEEEVERLKAAGADPAVIAELNSEIATLKGEIATKNAKIAELEEDKTISDARIKELETKIAELEAAGVADPAEIARLNGEIARLNGEIVAKDARIAALEATAPDATKIAALEAKILLLTEGAAAFEEHFLRNVARFIDDEGKATSTDEIDVTRDAELELAKNWLNRNNAKRNNGKTLSDIQKQFYAKNFSNRSVRLKALQMGNTRYRAVMESLLGTGTLAVDAPLSVIESATYLTVAELKALDFAKKQEILAAIKEYDRMRKETPDAKYYLTKGKVAGAFGVLGAGLAGGTTSAYYANSGDTVVVPSEEDDRYDEGYEKGSQDQKDYNAGYVAGFEEGYAAGYEAEEGDEAVVPEVEGTEKFKEGYAAGYVEGFEQGKDAEKPVDPVEDPAFELGEGSGAESGIVDSATENFELDGVAFQKVSEGEYECFDSEGNFVGMASIERDEDGNLVSLTMFDENGDLASVTSVTEDGRIVTVTYGEDEDGNPTPTGEIEEGQNQTGSSTNEQGNEGGYRGPSM